MVTCEHRIREFTPRLLKITNCNGDNACGNKMFMAAICFKPGSTGDTTVIETPFVSWNHLLRQGYLCIPCCILDQNVHYKMKACDAMPLTVDVRNQNQKHGRCGIEFNP